MTLVRSGGTLETIGAGSAPVAWGSAYGWGVGIADYTAIYRTQPAVRTVVDFLGRNVAQLGLHVFRRVSDTDRVRLTDYPLAKTLGAPNPYSTTYRLIDATVHDLAVYGNAFWVKVGTPADMRLVRVRAQNMTPLGDNWLAADAWRLSGPRGYRDIPTSSLVHLLFYNPDDERIGLSPVETLRRILAEDAAANQYRADYWRNSARVSGVIERPVDAPKWSDPAAERFKTDWRVRFGVEGSEAGGTPVLEDGMTFRETSYSAQDSQYVESRRLTWEEIASAYFVPPPMIGLLEHATFSNITEQHKMLYQDTLGPWLAMIEQDIGLQLIPEFPDSADVYVEFNIAAKLAGSFDEQTSALQTATGAPVMARNEARARVNLPRIDDPTFDVPVTPLNVLTGTPGDTEPMPPEVEPTIALPPGTKASIAPMPGWVARHRQAFAEYFDRQGRTVVARLGGKARKADPLDAAWGDDDRWNRELAAVLLPLARGTAQDAGNAVAADLDGSYDVDDVGLPYLRATVAVAASSINSGTKRLLADALVDASDPVAAAADVFRSSTEGRADQLARGRVTAASSFGRTEAARANGGRSKTWSVTSRNPRPSHAALAGETVALDERFSNGGLWPGDPELPVEEVANCSCVVTFD